MEACQLQLVSLCDGYEAQDLVINGMSGIVIIAIISWVVATFGIRIFHYYER